VDTRPSSRYVHPKVDIPPPGAVVDVVVTRPAMSYAVVVTTPVVSM
jgi:hypothetical protein